MRNLSEAIKTQKPWHVGLLVAALLVSISGAYSIYYQVIASDKADLNESQYDVPAQYGNWGNQISATGTLIFPDKETLSFGSNGTVEEIYVKEGQEVVEGQVLAKIDRTTLASLERAVARERANLVNTEKALDQGMNPPPVVLAQAQAVVASDRMRLLEVQEDLTDFEAHHALQLAQARLVKADAEVALEGAQQDLADLELHYNQNLAQAHHAKAFAELLLDEAQKNLAYFWPRHAQQLAQARQAKADAEVVLQEAQATLTDYEPNYVQQLSQARQTQADAEIALKKAQDALSEFRFTIVIFDPDVHRRLQIQVEFKQTQLINALNKLAKLELGPNSIQEQQFEAAVELAKADLKVAQEILSEMEAQVSLGNNLSLQVDSGEKDQGLVATTAGAKLPEVAMLEVQVVHAKANLLEAENLLAQLLVGLNPTELALKEAQVAMARETLSGAELDLAALLGGPEPLELALREAQVAVAQEILSEAEENLAELLEGPDPWEVALLETTVALAQVTLEESQERLGKTTLRSPITGIVSLVSAEVGDAVDQNATIIEISDPTVVEVDARVSEAEVLGLRESVQTTVTLPALPDHILDGILSEIAPVALDQQGAVFFPIRIRLAVPEGLQLREGLSAVVGIVLPNDPDLQPNTE